jgi:hypothetical protein
MRLLLIPALGAVALAACNEPAQQASTSTQRPIEVRSAEQDQLHTLNAINLAIALKRAIYDAGFTCRRVTDGGFIGKYKNLDMWMARCSEGRDWAIFAGPDGSAQVRDCTDLPGTEVPVCKVTKRPEGEFSAS